MATSAEIEKLFEPIARAARRGDAQQIRQVLTKLRAAQRNFMRGTPEDSERDMVRGMIIAIEGILGIVLAGSGADHRFEILSRYPYALSVMAVLGRHARAALLGGQVKEQAMRADEIENETGISFARIQPIMKALVEGGIVLEQDKGSGLNYELTGIGAELLESQWPGWQVA